MDATGKQHYRTHFVMNTPRSGRELAVWIVRLPERCSLDESDLASDQTPQEILKAVDGADRSVSPIWLVTDQSRFLRKSH